MAKETFVFLFLKVISHHFGLEHHLAPTQCTWLTPTSFYFHLVALSAMEWDYLSFGKSP